MSSAAVAGDSPYTNLIRRKLEDVFQPQHLEVECESNLHNVPLGTEAHFRVQIVSDKFEGLSLVQRQRMVNKALATELETFIHALRLDTKKPSEWNGEAQNKAPACGGGHGH